MSAKVAESAEPDLTPLLDIVFQLITFFMLVINFSNDNYDQRVRLPVAGTARPVEEGAKLDEDRLVLNVDRDGHLLLGGQVLTAIKAEQEIKRQARLVKLNLDAAAGKRVDVSGGLPTTIVLRADRDTKFTNLFSLITACQTHGFHKFALKAMNAAG